MGEILVGLISIAGLAGILLFILGGMRSGHGAAKSFRGFSRYRDPKPWAAALLGGLAVAAIAQTLSGPAEAFAALALFVGAACGLSDGSKGILSWAVGLVGAVAAVCASYEFLAGSGPDFGLHLTLVAGLGIVFTFLGIFRRQPHRGLAWFAIVEIMAFLLSPLGGSLLDLPAVAAYGSLAVTIGVVVALALMAQAALTLFAAGVALTAIPLAAMGLGGNLAAQITYVILALLAFLSIGFVRGHGRVTA